MRQASGSQKPLLPLGWGRFLGLPCFQEAIPLHCRRQMLRVICSFWSMRNPLMIAPANPLEHHPAESFRYPNSSLFCSLSTSLPPSLKLTAEAPKNTSLFPFQDSVFWAGVILVSGSSFATLRASQIFIAFDVSGIHINFNILIHSFFHFATTLPTTKVQQLKHQNTTLNFQSRSRKLEPKCLSNKPGYISKAVRCLENAEVTHSTWPLTHFREFTATQIAQSERQTKSWNWTFIPEKMI